MNDNLDVSYNMKRYDATLLITYQLFSWFEVSGSFGYTQFSLDAKVNADGNFSSQLKELTGEYFNQLIEKRTTINVNTVFGFLGLKFKFSKSL